MPPFYIFICNHATNFVLKLYICVVFHSAYIIEYLLCARHYSNDLCSKTVNETKIPDDGGYIPNKKKYRFFFFFNVR